jgi:hypothetical protein
MLFDVVQFLWSAWSDDLTSIGSTGLKYKPRKCKHIFV